jgi:hypothetical protein
MIRSRGMPAASALERRSSKYAFISAARFP